MCAKTTDDQCRVASCTNKIDVKKHRLCGKHYQALWRYGDPLGSPHKRRSVPCTAPDCDRIGSSVTGLCHMHSLRRKRTGRLDLAKREPSRCATPGCESSAICRGLCQSHYDKQRGSQRGTAHSCSSPGCEKKVKARGLCHRHYGELQRRGAHETAPLAARTTKPATERPCRGCMADLTGLPRAQRYCSDACKPRCSGPECNRPVVGRGLCSTHSKKRNAGIELRPIGEPLERQPDSPCEWCTDPVGTDSTARFCSIVCRNLARRHMKAATRGECAQCGVHIDYLGPANGTSGRLTPVSKRLCDVCRRRSPSLYMSAEQLRERDGDNCHLCGLYVPPAARKPHPLAAEVDHILPTSHAGTHDPENLALAHKTCNIAKGNKSAKWRRDPAIVAPMLTEWNNGVYDQIPPATCSVSDCERRPESHGMCQKHRRRVMKHGTAELPSRPTVCAADNCDKAIRAKGLCRSHYRVHLIAGKRCAIEGCGKKIHTRQMCRRHYQQWLDDRPEH